MKFTALLAPFCEGTDCTPQGYDLETLNSFAQSNFYAVHLSELKQVLDHLRRHNASPQDTKDIVNTTIQGAGFSFNWIVETLHATEGIIEPAELLFVDEDRAPQRRLHHVSSEGIAQLQAFGFTRDEIRDLVLPQEGSNGRNRYTVESLGWQSQGLEQLRQQGFTKQDLQSLLKAASDRFFEPDFGAVVAIQDLFPELPPHVRYSLMKDRHLRDIVRGVQHYFPNPKDRQRLVDHIGEYRISAVLKFLGKTMVLDWRHDNPLEEHPLTADQFVQLCNDAMDKLHLGFLERYSIPVLQHLLANRHRSADTLFVSAYHDWNDALTKEDEKIEALIQSGHQVLVVEAATVWEIEEALRRHPKQSLQRVIIHAHADSQAMNLLGEGGVRWLYLSANSSMGLGKLANRLAAGAQVFLDGCETGLVADDNNLTQHIYKIWHQVPQLTVYGSPCIGGMMYFNNFGFTTARARCRQEDKMYDDTLVAVDQNGQRVIGTVKPPTLMIDQRKL